MAYDSAIPLQSYRYNMATAAITTAWTILPTTVAQHSQILEVYNSSLGTLQLGTGNTAAVSYAIPMNIFPSGGNGRIGCLLDQGASLWIRSALAETISAGVFMLNLFR